MAKEEKTPEKKRDWYAEGGKDAEGEGGTGAESVTARHARERDDMFGRHGDAISTLMKAHQKESATLMERHVAEIGAGGPGGPEATPAGETAGNAMTPAKA